MTLKELLLEVKGGHITYSQYLSTDEWKQKSEEINKRDNYCCTQCGKTETITVPDAKTQEINHVWLEDGDIVDMGEGNFSVDPKVTFSDKHYHLEVHHKRYIFNRLPWDYNNDDLITLCNHCHTEFHQHKKVPVYSEDELIELDYTPCPRCNGTGYLPEYRHVQNGVCFKCMGNRYSKPLINKRIL